MFYPGTAFVLNRENDMDMFERIIAEWLNGYPRMGEIKRYKVVEVTEEEIAQENIELLKKRIADKKKDLEALEEELTKQKKRLKP